MSDLDDVLKQLDEEILDGAVEALHLKHLGDTLESKVLEEEVAHLRREHRRLLLKGYYEVVGAVQPDVEQPEVGRRLHERLMVKVKKVKD